MSRKELAVVENVLKANDEVAAELRARFREAGVFVVDLIGAPGCGKTALLEATLQQLGDALTMGVLVGDLATARDGERLERHTPHVVQINTGKSCHLEAHQIRRALEHVDLAALDVLVIENVGNLICPVGFDVGHDAKVGMLSVTEGDDKPAKHPHLIQASTALLLNKTDLLPHFDFDTAGFERDAQRLNPGVPLLQVAARAGDIAPWREWLLARRGEKREPASAAPARSGP